MKTMIMKTMKISSLSLLRGKIDQNIHNSFELYSVTKKNDAFEMKFIVFKDK